jgi:hypothetical protein
LFRRTTYEYPNALHTIRIRLVAMKHNNTPLN